MWKVRKRKDAGIVFRQETVMKQDNRLLLQGINLIFELVLVTTFMLTMAWCLVTGLNLIVLPLKLNVGIILSVAVFYGLFHIPKYKTILVPISAFSFVVYVYLRKQLIIEGFHFAANHFIGLFNIYYESNLTNFLVEEAGEATSVTITILFVVVLVIGLFSLLRWGRHRAVLSVACTLPMLILPLVIGELPQAVYLAGYLIIMVALLGGGARSSNQPDYRVHMKATILILVAGIGIFSIAYHIFTPKEYEKKEEIKQVKTTIQTALINFSKDDFFDNTWLEELLPFGDGVASGGLSGGKLGRTEKVVFSNETALVVTVPNVVEDKLYLRGYIGSNYNGNYWGQLSPEDKQQYDALMEEFNNKKLSTETIGLWGLISDQIVRAAQTMKIQNVNVDGKISFLPYVVKSKVYVNKKGLIQLTDKKSKDTYSVQYYPYFNRDITKLIDYVFYQEPEQSMDNYELKQEYNDFAYSVYTKIQAKDSKAATLFKDYKLAQGENTFYNVLNRVLGVQNYLHEGTKYSLSPGMLPQGKDFVDYFLFENKKGYCTHYASAATVLFRSLGIPARYVEGYVVTSLDWKKGSLSKKDNTVTMNLKDTNAHAWVEVYVKELGWLPVEVTPGYTQGDEVPQEILNQIQKNANLNSKPLPSFLPNNTAPTPPIPVTQKTGKAGKLTLVDKNEPISYLIRILQVVAGAAMVLLVAALLTILRKEYWNYQRKKLLHEGDSKKIISFYYREWEKILNQYGLTYNGDDYMDYTKRVEEKLDFLNSGQFSRGFSIVLESGFSDIPMEEKEAEEVISLYSAIYQGVYDKAPRTHRIIMKIFSNIR